MFSLVTLMIVSIDGLVSRNPQLTGEVPGCGRQEGAQEEYHLIFGRPAPPMYVDRKLQRI